MKTKEKRSSIRIPLLSESVKVFAAEPDIFVTKEYVFQMDNISSEGAFIVQEKPFRSGIYIQLEFNLPGELGNLRILGRTAHCIWQVNKKKNKLKTGVGVQLFPDPKTKKIFDAYLIYMRNKQIITVSKRIIEEFFGDKDKNAHH